MQRQGGQFLGVLGGVGGSSFGVGLAGGIVGSVAAGPPASGGTAPWPWPSASLASDRQATSQPQAGAAVGGFQSNAGVTGGGGGSGGIGGSGSGSGGGPLWPQAPPVGSCVFTMGFSPPGAGARRLGAAGRPRPGSVGGSRGGGGGSCRQRFRMRTAPGRGPLRLPA